MSYLSFTACLLNLHVLLINLIAFDQSMKDFGCKSCYHKERMSDLLRAYFFYMKTCKHVFMPDVFKRVVEMPAERFWVSAPRATVVVASIMRGDNLHYMRPNKREMFFEIHRRVLELRNTYSDWSMPRLIKAVITQPAPKFYMAPGSARVLILKARKQWFLEKSKRLRGC